MTVLVGQSAARYRAIAWIRGLATTESFQWFRGETPIPGATGWSYTLQEEDVGWRISRETRRVPRAWAWWLR
jgi:hypothetical protein